MRTPTTYAEWAICIDALKVGGKDSEALSCMREGTLSWSAGVAERFSKLLLDTVNHRMNSASDRFSRAMDSARGNENAVIGALLAVRKEYSFLHAVVQIPAIPESYRVQYAHQVVDQIKRVQESLETSAKIDRTGRLSSIIRNNRVDKI